MVNKEREEREIATDPKTNPDRLHELALGCSKRAKQLIAVHPNASPKTLKRLAKENLGIKLLVADHPNTPIEVLENWSKPPRFSISTWFFPGRVQQEALLARQAIANLLNRGNKDGNTSATPSCPHCDFPLIEDSVFCSKCGAKVEDAPKAGFVCAHCGSPITRESVFCWKCGKKGELALKGAQGNQSDRPCPACAASIPRESTYCLKCGARVAGNPTH